MCSEEFCIGTDVSLFPGEQMGFAFKQKKAWSLQKQFEFSLNMFSIPKKKSD
jgi:hypothetical protein